MEKSILTKVSDVYRWFREHDVSVLAFDTEVYSLDWDDMDIIGMSFCNGRAACYIDADKLATGSPQSHLNPPRSRALAQVLTCIAAHFKERVRVLIGHNLPFDLKVLARHRVTVVPPSLFCTMTAAHLLDENGPKGLKDLAQIYLGVRRPIRWEEAIEHGLSSPTFYKYALQDAIYTYRLYELQKRRLMEEGLVGLFEDEEMPFQLCLRDLMVNGILIDKDKLKKAREEVDKLIHETKKEIYELLKPAGVVYSEQVNLLGELELFSTINLNSSQQVVKALQKLGIELEETTEGGQFSTKTSVLEKLKNKHPVIPALLKHRRLAKLKSAFLDALPQHIDKDGRVRPSYSNTTAVTGRLSCSSPNLQQLPRNAKDLPISVRDMFVAPKGRKLICADYSGQELRILAVVSGDETMLNAFRNNQDLHLTTAKKFFNLPIPDEVLCVDHPQHEEVKEKYKEERTKSKTINFGIAYGKTAEGFARDWNISVEEAQEFIDKYFETFPKVKQAIKRATACIHRRKEIRNLAGRKRRFPGRIDARACRQAFNFLILPYSRLRGGYVEAGHCQGEAASRILQALGRSLGVDGPR